MNSELGESLLCRLLDDMNVTITIVLEALDEAINAGVPDLEWHRDKIKRYYETDDIETAVRLSITARLILNAKGRGS